MLVQPTWFGDSIVYFRRQSDDGRWSIFQVELPEDFEFSRKTNAPVRITPPGVHAFTLAAIHDGKRIVIATRWQGKNFRYIEIFDVKSKKYYTVMELLNPNFYHCNPFVSSESGFLGYHRFQGESPSSRESTIPHLEPVISSTNELRMLRLDGSFPSFSSNGIAFNHDFDAKSGLKIIKSDGSKRWTVLKGRTTFYNSWSPTEKNVIFTSIKPIFKSVKKTVQIARVNCLIGELKSNSFKNEVFERMRRLILRAFSGF